MAKNVQFDIERFHAQRLPSEEEIMSTWEGIDEKPVVSILCHAYNHKPYIEDAIRGFLIQKTTFPFEVILHDDASTDGTTDIVREYSDNYRNIIKSVIQTENQFSQGKRPTMLSFPHSKGEYIAMCEGDDFWICNDKLSIQLNKMKMFPDIEISFHSAILLKQNGSQELFCVRGDKSEVKKVTNVIAEGGPFMPTASFLFRRSFFERLDTFDSDFVEKRMKAYLMQVFASHPNGALYINSTMSLYRDQSIGSWSESIKNNDNFCEWISDFIVSVIESNRLLNFNYDEQFKVVIGNKLYSLMNNLSVPVATKRLLLNKYREFLTARHRTLWFLVFSNRRVHMISLKLYAALKKCHVAFFIKKSVGKL